MGKKVLVLIAVCFLLISSLIGCAGDQALPQSTSPTITATQSPPTSQQPTTTTPAAPATTTITVTPVSENKTETKPAVTSTPTISGPPFTENKTAIAQMVFPVSTNITRDSLVEPDVVYGVAGGVQLKMDIYYPKQYGAKVPVVIYVHGGGFQSGDKRDITVARWMPSIIARGYMVVSLNYRLVAQGGTFPGPVEDVKNAVRWLRGNAAKYRIDVNKIGVIGGSAGGYLVNMMGLCDASAGFDTSGGYLNQSSRVQAVVDMYGIADIAFQYEKSTYEGPNGPVAKLINNPNQFYEVAPKASPINYVSPDDPPFLIIHGDKDDQVLPQQSEVLYNKMVAANVPATLVWVKNAGHGFVPMGTEPVSPGIPDIIKMVADFFDKYLK